MSPKLKQTGDAENYQGVHVVPVIGSKNSGKSSFFSQLLEETVELEDGLDCGSTAAKYFEVPAGLVERKISLWDSKLAKLVIVDTPVYNDRKPVFNSATIQNLREIPKLLTEKYGTDWKFAGVVNLHDRSVVRGSEAARHFFDRLWGEIVHRVIMLGATRRSKIQVVDGRTTKKSEQDLRNFWKDMGGRDWVVYRVDDENTLPWTLLETVLLKNMSPAFHDQTSRARFEKMQGTYIIPVMGPTGAGKSTFINRLLGTEAVKVGSGLTACTIQLQEVVIPGDVVNLKLPDWDPNLPKKLIMIDTPGFDDTSADDSEVLQRVARWLAKSYGAGAKLAGVIYLQEITQARITGATKRNVEVFDKLCGGDACRSVVLGTTKWMDVPDSKRAITEAKEQEIRTRYWKDMITRGSTMQRVDDKQTNASPWDLVQAVISNLKGASPSLLIHQELVEMRKRLPHTEAGTVMSENVEELIKLLKSEGMSKADIRLLLQEIGEVKERSNSHVG